MCGEEEGCDRDTTRIFVYFAINFPTSAQINDVMNKCANSNTQQGTISDFKQ